MQACRPPEMAAALRCPPSVCLFVPAPVPYAQPIPRKPPLSCHRACRASVRCADANKPSPPSPTTPDSSEVSSMAKIRSEVLSPYRSVRMFFYLAFMASGALGGLIALTQLLPALSNPSRAAGAADTLKGLGIDVAAVSLFAFLYSRESKAKDAQVARLTREERLSRLKLRAGAEGRPFALGELRGAARLVIVAGPADFVAESFRRSQPLLRELAERAVLAVPFATDGSTPEMRVDDGSDEDGDDVARRSKRLWQLTPVYTAEWAQWLDDQKKLAGVQSDAPVYLSLRMDGRVRGSGVGYPPWQAFVAQLPPVKGMWSGLLDGMDGRVL
ncbi:hypothetical protein BS78_06G153500 [Paspalum vaginatum]|nr:hypothetical protein BS78_06G153500 [Paspalum vaginatum]